MANGRTGTLYFGMFTHYQIGDGLPRFGVYEIHPIHGNSYSHCWRTSPVKPDRIYRIDDISFIVTKLVPGVSYHVMASKDGKQISSQTVYHGQVFMWNGAFSDISKHYSRFDGWMKNRLHMPIAA